MNACNFQAPNGKNSLLYTGLEQLLGAEKAAIVWNQVQSDEFKEKHGDWTQPTIKKYPSKNHPMSYRMPAGANRTGKDTTTLSLIEEGLRIATTRSYPLGKVGDIVTFEGRPTQYRITEVEQLTAKKTEDPKWIEKWSQKEQWTTEYFKDVVGKVNTVKVGSWQTTFEKVTDTEIPTDANGEPTLEWVKQKLQLDRAVTDPAPAEQRTVTLDDLLKTVNDKGKTVIPTEESVAANIERLYQRAVENPQFTFVVDIQGNIKDRVYLSPKNYITMKRLAYLLNRLPKPYNVTLSDDLESIRQNLPQKFITQPQYQQQEFEPLQYDEAIRKKQMDSSYVPVRNADGSATGRYFNTEKQIAVVNTMIAIMHRTLSRAEQLKRKISAADLKVLVKKSLDEARSKYKQIADGQVKDSPMSAMTASNLYEEFGLIINSFDTAKGLSFWPLAVQRMEDLGFPLKEGKKVKRLDLDALNELVEDSEDSFQQLSGEGLTDWSDAHFEKDPKETASGRIKMFIATTPDSRVGTEETPRKLPSLSFSNPETRKKILMGEKTIAVRTLEQATKMKLNQPGQQAIAEIEGKQFRVTVKRIADAEDTAVLKERILEEEGIDISEQPSVLLALEEFKAKPNVLIPNRTYLGTDALADYEQLYNDVLALLAGQHKSLDNYIRIMREAGQTGANPNLWALADRLKTAPRELQNEFVSVVTNHYNEFTMVLVEMKAADDGTEHYVLKPTNANRGSQLSVLVNNWKQNQKFAPILTRNAVGITVIDKQKAAELKAELLKLRDNWNKEAAVELMKKTFQYNGITLTDSALKSFETNAGKWTKNTSLSGEFERQFALGNDENNERERPLGLISTLIMRLNGKGNEQDNEGDIEDDKSYMVDNPLYTEGTVMNILAKLAAAYTPALYSFTHRSSEGKTIYDYGYNSLLTTEFQKLMTVEGIMEFEGIDIARNSFLLTHLKDSEKTREKGKLVYMDGIRNTSGKSDSGVVRSKMSDREQMLTALGLFQNRGSANFAHYVSLTHSDKTTTPVFMNMPRITLVTHSRKEKNKITGDIEWKRAINPVAITHVANTFYAEYDRYVRASQVKDYNDPKYVKGASHFFFMPEMNKERLAAAVRKGTVPQWVYTAIWDAAGNLNPKDGSRFAEAVNFMAEMRIEKMTQRTLTKWTKLDIVTEEGNILERTYLHRLLGAVGVKQRKLTKDGKTVYEYQDLSGTSLNSKKVLALGALLAARDYAVNSYLFNTSLSQLLFGDPAQVWKGTVEKTMVEYGKRLAKDLAPGREGAFKPGEEYNTITLADYLTNVKNVNEVQELYDQYKGVNASDAQELVTVQEHLDVLYAYGRITDTVYKEMTAIVNNPDSNGFYKFTKPEHRAVIMQPMKPVYAGPRKGQNGARLYDYVKSSAYPLYPEFTAGRELDKLRLFMENTRVNGKSIARANFESAKKIGIPATVLKVFRPDGTVDESAFSSLELEKAVQSLSRDHFRIQQEVPYDEEKETIRTVSQMNKLLTVALPQSLAHIPERKAAIRKRLFRINQAKLLTETGMELVQLPQLSRGVFGVNAVVIRDRKRLLDLLEQRLLDGSAGFTANDLAYVQDSNRFNTEELVIPLMFAPSASKFELMLLSMVSEISDIQMPGYSYVQTSPAGTGMYKKWEDLNESEKEGIVWVEGYDGSELKTLRPGDGKSQAAQVLVPFNFMVKGKRVSVDKFVTTDDKGQKWIDPNKIPKELLQLIGARIPNQGPNSMLPMEVVGFVPENMGDVMIVPAAITKQMGSDFDVDKIYAYRRPYVFRNGRFKVADGTPWTETSEFKEIERLGADSQEYTKLENRAKEILEQQGEQPDENGRFETVVFRKALGEAVKEAYPDGNVPKHVARIPVKTDETADNVEEEDVLKNDYFEVHWEVLTHPDMLTQVRNPLDKPDLREEAQFIEENSATEEDEMDFFSGVYQLTDFQSQKDAKQLVGLASLSTTFNAVIQDKAIGFGFSTYERREDGSYDVIVVDEQLQLVDEDGTHRYLSTLSGKGTSVYRRDGQPESEGLRRSKHDNITSMQSEFLDYARNRISDKVHLNLVTYPAAAALIMLQERDGWAPSLKYVTRLMSQPVIKTLAQMLSQMGDSLSGNFDKDLKKNVISELRTILLKQLNAERDKSPLSYKDLTDALTKGQETPGFLQAQLKALDFFEKLDQIGGQMIRVQSTINQDTKGAGAGLLNLLQQDNSKVQTEAMTGSSSENWMLTNVEALFEDTEQGELYNIIHNTANTLVGEFFPYQSLMPVYDSIMEKTNRTELSIRTQKNVFNAMKSYVFSDPRLGLWENPEAARVSLLYNKDGESLARRILKARESWASQNYLLQRLQLEIDPDSLSPDHIYYLSSKATQLDDKENTRAWLELLTSEDPEHRKLGEDLVRYNLLVGGIQDSRTFMRYIPYSYLVGTDFGVRLNEITQTIENLADDHRFVEQWFQHNPSAAMKLSPELEELGKMERYPERFVLPVISPEVATNTEANPPHKRLFIKASRGTYVYPDYLSYYDNKENKQILYKRVAAESYLRIDTLGDKNMDEYSYGESTMSRRSLIPENRSKAYSNIEAQVRMVNGMIATEPFTEIAEKLNIPETGGQSQINEMLAGIAADEQVAEHLRMIAAVLGELGDGVNMVADTLLQQRSPGEAVRPIRFELKADKQEMIKATGKPSDGVMDAGTRTLYIRKDGMRNRNTFAEVLTHELIHDKSAWILTMTQTDAELKEIGLEDDQIIYLRETWELMRKQYPTLEKTIGQLEDIRLQAIAQLKKEMESRGYSYEELLRRIKAGESPTTPYTTLVYGTMNIKEFVSFTLTNQDMMRFLNKHQAENSGRSMLTRIIELLSKMFAAIKETLGADVNSNSLLEHAVQRSMELMTSNKLNGLDEVSRINAVQLQLKSGAIVSPVLTAMDRMIARLKEQKEQITHSLHGKLSKEQYAEKKAKITELEDDIRALEAEGDFEMVGQIGKRYLQWVESVLKEDKPDITRLATASSILNIWKNLINTIYETGTVDKPDTVFSEIASNAVTLYGALIAKQKALFLEVSGLSSIHFGDKLQDTGSAETHVRSLSSAATSQVIQYQAMFMETVARRRDQEDVNIARWAQELETEMAAAAGGKKNLPEFYKQFMQQNKKGDAWGLVQRFSQDWYDYRRMLRARRHKAIESAAKEHSSKDAAVIRKKAWQDYWTAISKVAMFADTRYLFDRLTGERVDNEESRKHIAELEAELGKETTDELIQEAQRRFKDYLEKKAAHDELIDAEVEGGAKTYDDGNRAKTEFEYKYSPNVFFNNFKSKLGDFKDMNSDQFVRMVPKRSANDGLYYDAKFEKIQSDEKLKTIYDKYLAKLIEFKQMLPVYLQSDLGANWLPVVQREILMGISDIPAWVRSLPQKGVDLMTASDFEIATDNNDYRKIPIDYIDADRVELENRSTDLPKILMMFGMSVNHYSHFTEAKNFIDMGENIMRSIHEARVSGTQQQQVNGKITTVKGGLFNALQGLEYLRDYLMYKRSRSLEGPLGTKIYSPNPIKQRKMANEVKAILVQIEDINKQLSEGDGDPIELMTKRAELEKELNKYEGRTLYGSKMGDQLIRFNQLKTLSYNPFSAFANITFGMVSAWIHSNGRKDFTPGELARAHKTIMHSVGKWLSFGTAESDTAYKMLAVMDNLGVIGDYVDSHYGNVKLREKKPGWKRAISPYNWMRSGDYVMKSVTVRAMLDHHKVKVTEDGVEKEISLWDALDEDGNWNAAKYGENPDWKMSTDLTKLTSWDRFKNRVVRVNMIIHGNQDRNSPKLWYRSIWGRLIGQFRLSWLPEGWYARFGSEREDLMLGRTVKGRYRTYAQLGLIGSLGVLVKQTAGMLMKIDPFTGARRSDGKPLSEVDIENMRRNLAEIAFIMSTVALVTTLRYLADDDDEKRRSTMLILNSVLRVQQDLTFYSSPMTFDNLTRNVIPAVKVLTDGWKAAKASVRLMMDDEYEFQQWLYAMFRAGLPVPQATLIPKTDYMIHRDLGDLQR